MSTKTLDADRAIKEIVSGLVLSAVFGGLILFHGGWFWVILLAFAGLLPAIKGALTLHRLEDEARREILRFIQRHGEVTKGQIAAETSLSVKQMTRALDKLTRGDGTIFHASDDERDVYRIK